MLYTRSNDVLKFVWVDLCDIFHVLYRICGTKISIILNIAIENRLEEYGEQRLQQWSKQPEICCEYEIG